MFGFASLFSPRGTLPLAGIDLGFLESPYPGKPHLDPPVTFPLSWGSLFQSANAPCSTCFDLSLSPPRGLSFPRHLVPAPFREIFGEGS